jgi:hypothetical protein
LTPRATSDDYTVDELCVDYLEFARRYYIRDGKPTDEVYCVESLTVSILVDDVVRTSQNAVERFRLEDH